ncbi:hypothetical protein MKZ38_004201 [Zalerion maritima]|uniref:Uncharacterized protein n=1 Tax=Zalerion maritima TaxID=339359 RepID=A0AAD5RLX2_9PEZI|nr:hypothetical protein MKZ38_004201 [Zalerion maritima]
MEFSGSAFPGGKPVELKGTAQTIMAQLKKINPNYLTDFPRKESPTAPDAGTGVSYVTEAQDPANSLFKPQGDDGDEPKAELLCEFWDAAKVGDIKDAIDTLAAMDGLCETHDESLRQGFLRGLGAGVPGLEKDTDRNELAGKAQKVFDECAECEKDDCEVSGKFYEYDGEIAISTNIEGNNFC